MNEKLETEIREDNGMHGTFNERIVVEITADSGYEDEFDEIREAVREVLA